MVRNRENHEIQYPRNLMPLRYIIVLKNTLKNNFCIYSNKVIMTHKMKYIEVLQHMFAFLFQRKKRIYLSQTGTTIVSDSRKILFYRMEYNHEHIFKMKMTLRIDVLNWQNPETQMQKKCVNQCIFINKTTFKCLNIEMLNFQIIIFC